MSYVTKLKRSLSLYNFKKGFDETAIYGPSCVFFEIILIFLLIFDVLALKIFVALTFIIAYTFFVYFPFHKNGTITFFVFGVPLGILGFYTLVYEKVAFAEIRTISYAWWIIISLTFVIESLALTKNNINKIDITFNYFYRNFGFMLAVALVPASYIAFPVFAGSYYLFGKAHICLWTPIFFFWIISNIRLFIYKVLK